MPVALCQNPILITFYLNTRVALSELADVKIRKMKFSVKCNNKIILIAIDNGLILRTCYYAINDEAFSLDDHLNMKRHCIL